MAKQTHDPGIWQQGWFTTLPKDYKILYIFACNHANEAGIWRTDKIYFEELNEDIHIDFNKFLAAVNKFGDQVSVLPNNTWFINYHITSKLGSTYKPTNDRMIKALKIAFLSGVPLEWIKGFNNPEKIDKEAVENAHIQTAVKYLSGTPRENVLTPQGNIKPTEPITVVKQLQGVAPNYILPEISYTSFGGKKSEELERWFDEYSFSDIIDIKKINSAPILLKYVHEFIERVRAKRFMDVDAISDYFEACMRGKPKGEDLTLNNGTDPPNKSNNKFSSIKKYQDLKNARKNNSDKKEDNDKKT